MSRLKKFVIGLSAAVLVGCSGGGEDPQPSPPPATEEAAEEEPAEPEEPEEEPAPEVETRTVWVDGGEAEVAVGPLAIDGDAAVLRVEVTALEDGVKETFSHPYLKPPLAPTSVQLLDAENGHVYDHGWSDQGDALTQSPGSLSAGESKEFFITFQSPATSEPIAVVPGAGFFTPPVIDAADVDGFPSPAELADGVLNYPVSELQTYSEELGGTLAAREGDEGTILTVSADVLFDKDSADLSGAADEALERAAGKIRGEGELQVIGHTDDVGSREHNQDLSEARAASVAAALEDLVNLADFDVTVEGRAFDEPSMEGSSEEARAENRRVEIVFTPGEDTHQARAQQGELPDPTGPVGTGEEGVTLVQQGPGDIDEKNYEVRLPRVQRFGEYLTAEIELTNLDDEEYSLNSVFALGIRDSRGDLSLADQFGSTRLTLADGDVLYYPLDYSTPERKYVMRGGERKSMGQDLRSLDPGQTAIVTVVWPDIPGADTVTLESPWIPMFKNDPEKENKGGPPFRLTDIPVEDR